MEMRPGQKRGSVASTHEDRGTISPAFVLPPPLALPLLLDRYRRNSSGSSRTEPQSKHEQPLATSRWRNQQKVTYLLCPEAARGDETGDCGGA